MTKSWLLIALTSALLACSSDPTSPAVVPPTRMVLDGQWFLENKTLRIEDRSGILYVNPALTMLEFYVAQKITWTGDSAFYVVSNPDLVLGDTASFRFVTADSMVFSSKTFGSLGIKRTGE